MVSRAGRLLPALAMVRRAAVDQPLGFFATWGIGFAALLCVPLVTLGLRAGRIPNSVRVFDLGGWLGDVATLAMPLSERLSYVLGQPLVEVGVKDGIGLVSLSSPLAVHNLVTFVGLSGLMAVYITLLRRYVRERRTCALAGGLAAAYGAASAAALSGLSGASVTVAACCGDVIGPALLSLFGFEAGSSYGIVRLYGDVGELVGLAMMLATIVYLADRCKPPDRDLPRAL